MKYGADVMELARRIREEEVNLDVAGDVTPEVLEGSLCFVFRRADGSSKEEIRRLGPGEYVEEEGTIHLVARGVVLSPHIERGGEGE